MLTALKFVQGAVAKKDLVPSLTHFRIVNKTIKGYNGMLGLCAPIALDVDIAPNAVQLVRAIAACQEEISMQMTDNGKLCVRSGRFRSFVDCIAPESYPDIEPGGKMVKLDFDFMQALKYLEKFIAIDASRPWACGVLFDGESAYATNNIVLLQFWLGHKFPLRVNVPADAVRELLRIGDAPAHLQVTDTRLIFHYGDGRWLSTQLFSADWPDVAGVFAQCTDEGQQPVPAGLFSALEQLEPFCAEPCFYFKGNRVVTHADDEVAGTAVAVENVPDAGCFNVAQLLKLDGLVKTIDFASYPKPSLFYGDRARGILVGRRT